MKVYLSTLEISGTKVTGENPMPIFRSPEKDTDCKSDGTLLSYELEKFGWDIGYRVLPYRHLDKYTRNKKPILLKTAILENDRMKAVFLPEQGGRLYSMTDKSTGKDIFCINPVFQPANLGLRNAWFSGGVEWNIGQFAHSYSSNCPLFFAKVAAEDGEEFLRVYDYERIRKLYYQIDYHLPKGSDVLYAHTRIINDDPEDKPVYWWTNVALPEEKNVRVFSCTDEVMFIRPESMGSSLRVERVFGHAKLPYIPTLPDIDSTYPANATYSNEYFFQNSKDLLSTWGAAAYNDGRLFFERATGMLRYRKMFCWGSHRGGRKWCEFLAVPGSVSHYIEIQSGLAPSQLNGLEIKAGAVWSFTQAFGNLCLDDKDAPYASDWNEARRYVGGQIDRVLSEEAILLAEKRFAAYEEKTPEEILVIGPGWGALEKLRREKLENRSAPSGLVFPDASLTDEQLPWTHLLKNGYMPELDSTSVPASWMIDPKWKEILIKSLGEQGGESYVSRLHLGIMCYEAFEYDAAIGHWEASLAVKESPWAYRNLAFAFLAKGETNRAIDLMGRAVAMENNSIDKAFSEEYMQMLVNAKAFETAWKYYENLPEERKEAERPKMLAGVCAVELGNYEFAAPLFEREYAGIREGDNIMTDLWFRYTAKKEFEKRGYGDIDEIEKEIRKTQLPPAAIDFRMVMK